MSATLTLTVLTVSKLRWNFTWKLSSNLKFTWKFKGLRIARIILQKKKMGPLTLPNVVIKTMCWRKHRLCIKRRKHRIQKQRKWYRWRWQCWSLKRG